MRDMRNDFPLPDGLSAEVRDVFGKWNEVMYGMLDFNRQESVIHAHAHCSRVLLHGLRITSEALPGDADALEAVACAAIFHDTRRYDEYLDTGHGARAAVYYGQFCEAHREFMKFREEAQLMMRYHDLDDSRGLMAVEALPDGCDRERAGLLYKIFKDADALDRWRLGPHGLDERYLRTPQARSMVGYARELVMATMDAEVLREVSRQVKEAIGIEEKGGAPD